MTGERLAAPKRGAGERNVKESGALTSRGRETSENG